MATDRLMYECVRDAYPHKAWRDKVSKMHMNQIVAIYLRLEREKQYPKKTVTPVQSEPEYIQLTMEDLC